MKPIRPFSLLPLLASAALYANEPAESEHVAHHAPAHAETGFYTAFKGLITLGDDTRHGEGVTLKGKSGKGVGLELGYKIAHGFAVEADGTFARDVVTETRCGAEEESEEGEEEHTGGCHRIDADGEYYTISLDFVYLHHFTEHFGTFVKVGYEYEAESIDELEIKAYETGVIGAVGVEYIVGTYTAFMTEIEASSIEGPRGYSLFAGILYHF